jgi:hypothetical protein
MWADLRLWLPRLLAGESFEGVFEFEDDEATIRAHELRVVERVG